MSLIRLKYSVDGQISNMFNKLKKKAWINFKNILPEDAEQIKKFFKPIVRERNGVEELAFSTDKPSTWDDKFTEPIVKTLQFLEGTNHYAMPSIENIMEELKIAYKNIVTKDDMKNAEKSTDEIWLDFIKRLEDPEMQSLVKSISPYYMGDSIYGWKLAYANALKVKKEMPQATFVFTPQQWAEKFNRKVNLDAQRLLIKVPIDSEVYSKRETMNKVGYNQNTTYSDLSKQQKHHVDVSSRSGNAKHYTWVAVYDISQTTLMDGEEDRFNTEVGFKNNLTGELNDKAIQDKIKNGSVQNPEDINKLYHNENGNVRLIVNALSNAIKKEFPDLKVYLPKPNASEEDFNRAFQDMVMKIADRLIEEKAKIVRQENRQEGIKATLTAVSILTRLNPQQVALKLAAKEFEPKYYFELRDIINDIIKMINQNMPKQETKLFIKEMNDMYIKPLESVEELMNMLNVPTDNIKEKEEQSENKKETIKHLKENFYIILNNLNKKRDLI